MRKIIPALGLWLSLIPALPWAQNQGEGPPPLATPTPDSATLLQELGGDDSQQRILAKNGLIQMGESVIPAILKELPSAPPEKAYDLIMVLRQVDFKGAVDVLKQLWEEKEDYRIKLPVAMALCRLDEDYLRYQNFIVDVARKGEDNQRMTAMQMLGYIEDPRVVPALKEIFYDESQPDQIRQAAVWDLAFTPVRESAEVMVEMINNPEVDWFYKEILITAIRRLAANPELAEMINELMEKAQRLPGKKSGGADPRGSPVSK